MAKFLIKSDGMSGVPLHPKTFGKMAHPSSLVPSSPTGPNYGGPFGKLVFGWKPNIGSHSSV